MSELTLAPSTEERPSGLMSIGGAREGVGLVVMLAKRMLG